MSDPAPESQPSGHPRRVNWPLIATLIVIGMFLLWFIGDLAYVASDSEYDDAQDADVIIVLGCNIGSPDQPSPCMQARAAHAAALYKQGRAGYIIASGGQSHPEITEAAALSRLLERSGVPSDRIVQEDRARNTIQNVRYSAEIMRERGWKSAILVTEPFQIRRASLIAHDFGLLTWPSPAIASTNWDSPIARVYTLSRDSLSLMLYQAKMLVGIRE